MNSRDRLPPWHERHRLTNGRDLLIRPIRAEDAEPLRAGFALLQPELLRRMMSSTPELAEADAERLARPNARTQFTLVATDLEGPGEAVIAALASAETDPAGREGTFTVLASRFIAGLGMRRYLLTRVAKWAKSRGVGVLRGELPQDSQLLTSARSLGFRMVDGASDPSLVRVSLELPAR